MDDQAKNPTNSQIPGNSPIHDDPHQDIPPPPTPYPVTPEITHNADIEPGKVEPESAANPLLAGQEAKDETHSEQVSVSTPVSDNYISSPESISPPPSPSSNKTKLIGTIAAVILLAVAIPAGIFLTGQSQETREKAAGESCGEYGEVCPNGKVQVCQKAINENGECVFSGSCSGCENGAVCGNDHCEPGEGNNNCPADCQPSGGTCEGGLNPGDKKYDCTGNKAACRGEAGEGIPKVCEFDGNFTTYPSECTNECPVVDKSNCDYREECTINGKKGTKLCSGTKDSENVCKWNAEVSSCGGCTETPAQICNNNGNYEGGLLPGKANPDPNCAAQGGSYCNDGGNFNVCCYSDGKCYQGQIGACKNLGNGAIELKATAEILEFNCPGQTSSTGSCSENGTSKGIKGPGTYSVSGCGGRQIDAVGYCGSYSFGGTCQTGGPGPTIQCLDVKIYTTAGVRIVDPAGIIRPGDTIRVAVSGNTTASGGIIKARFSFNNGATWQETTSKNSAGEYYLDTTVAAGAFSIEAQVFSPVLGWE